MAEVRSYEHTIDLVFVPGRYNRNKPILIVLIRSSIYCLLLLLAVVPRRYDFDILSASII